MDINVLTEAERRALVARLRRDVTILLAERARRRQHHIACGFLLDADVTVCGLNIVSNLGPASVCAEQTTMGEVLKTYPRAQIMLALTVRATFDSASPFELVPPCGRCREVLCEYAPNALVAIPVPVSGSSYDLFQTSRLHPSPFYRRAP